ncbi:MAG: D-2-hydroxyacid dehydrogenase [Acutalibacteraceae bacterium]|nr:D-2-hydroxyacid dehydrogenase [Acutalibacteraceae bacterium]
MKILITDSASLKSGGDLSTEVLNKYGEICEFDNIDRSTLLNEVSDKDIIFCNKTVIDREVIDRSQKLKFIGVFATGYNNIDIEYAKEKGIAVCNAGSYSTNAVAQQVIAYILIHYTNIPKYNEFVKDGGWKRSKIFSPLVFGTDEVAGKTLGIVGYGNIGKAVEKAAKAIGMNVIVYTRTVRPNGVTDFVSFDELLLNSDVITLHCPLNRESADMMNAEAFAKCRDGAFFINTSRGGTVDEKALYDALCSGKLSGAAVDVLKQEPMSEDCILFGAPNIIITPHTSWAPLSTRKRLLGIACENLDAYLNGERKNRIV